MDNILSKLREELVNKIKGYNESLANHLKEDNEILEKLRKSKEKQEKCEELFEQAMKELEELDEYLEFKNKKGITLPRLNESEIKEMLEDIHNHLDHQDELLENSKGE